MPGPSCCLSFGMLVQLKGSEVHELHQPVKCVAHSEQLYWTSSSDACEKNRCATFTKRSKGESIAVLP